MGYPKGKGMYIWRFARLGSPEFVAQKAKEAGMDWVAVKLQDGAYVTDGSNFEDWKALQPERYIEALRAAGIRVHGWGYVYGLSKTQVDAEIKATLEAINQFRPDTWCIDAEAEYKLTPSNLASRYVTNVKLRIGDRPLGFTAYRYPSYHETFPWEVFWPNCDYASPQVYWVQSSNPRMQLEKCLAEYRQETDMPIVPVGCAYPEGSWRPTPGQVNEFYQAVIDNNLPGWSWWEWYYAWLDKGIWGALAAHKSNIEQPDNPEIPPAPVNKRKWWLQRLIEHVMR